MLHFSFDRISYKSFAHSMYQNMPIHHYCFKSFKIMKLIFVMINTFMQILKPINANIFSCFRFVELGICITFTSCTYDTYWNVIILYNGISVLKNEINLCNTMCWDWTHRETKCINDENDVKVLQNMLKCFTLHISWSEKTYTYLILGGCLRSVSFLKKKTIAKNNSTGKW